MTKASPDSLVRFEEVPRALDWKFMEDNQLSICEFRRQCIFLRQVS